MIGTKIPISKAKEVAKQFNYDHVIIIAWNEVDKQSWWTTYGKDKLKCIRTKEISDNLREHF